VGSVERLDVGQLVVCLMSGLGIFPERSVVNLAKFQQSSRQNSIFRIGTRIRFLVPKFAFGANLLFSTVNHYSCFVMAAMFGEIF